MEKEDVKSEQAIENKCPSCCASIAFNPKVGKWKCDYCGSEFTLEEMQKHSDNASNEDVNKKEEAVVQDNYDGYISYKCESCGAEIVADDQTAATFCVYCGNTAILKSKLSGKFTPSRIIPFKQEKEKAIEAFKGLSKGRPLMPKDFNNEKNIEKIKGVYIPFWLYDIGVGGEVKFDAKRVESWRVGDTHYTKTDTFIVTRGGTMNFSNIPVDASSRFDNDIMNTIEPFDFKELIPYNHAYLSGFFAEKYDEEGDTVYKEAASRAINTAKDELQKDVRGYTSTIMVDNKLQSQELNKDYVMLPVWMVNVKYKDKIHIFAMNGQTGEFVGNIPLDKNKVIIYSIVIFIISLLVCIIGSYIAFKMGGN
jgi:predicted RNA-binding Zn-ribbon protein involved in translation (DUF1610 family)/ribosomal protein L37AE/L43A